ncbi:hypothetical protein ACMA5I_11880 [Paracoccaceae bacterium GXU_MW_L88]
MDRLGPQEIEKLAASGETETLPGGAPGLRLTAQYPGRPTTRDRSEWAAELQKWEQHLAEDIREMGGDTVDGSLSMSGQTVELLVPLDVVEVTVRKLESQNIAVTLQRERRVDPSY